MNSPGEQARYHDKLGAYGGKDKNLDHTDEYINVMGSTNEIITDQSQFNNPKTSVKVELNMGENKPTEERTPKNR